MLCEVKVDLKRVAGTRKQEIFIKQEYRIMI